MGVPKSVQRNPLIPVMEAICRNNGFKLRIEPGNNHHTIFIIGEHNGKVAELKFPFPRICESFRTVPNFTAKFKRFVNEYTKEIGFLSQDPMFRPEVVPERKSTFVQKLNLDKPKKTLAVPKTILSAIQRDELPVMCPPYIPTTYVGEKKRDPNEPVSDTKMLAVFLVDVSDVALMVEVCEGIAKLRSTRPAPLRILSGTPQPHIPTPPPLPPIAPPIEREEPPKKPPVNIKLPVSNNVIDIGEKRQKKQGKISAMSAINQRIHSDLGKLWSSEDFLDIMSKKNSIQATLSLLTTAKKIKRTAPDRYIAIRSKAIRQ